MEKFIPYEKLSKKKKKELDSAKRGSWNGVNPVTKRVESKKVYSRKKALKWKDELPFQGFCFIRSFFVVAAYSCSSRGAHAFAADLEHRPRERDLRSRCTEPIDQRSFTGV